MSAAGRTVRRIVRQEPVAYVHALLVWTLFHSLPVLSGVLLKVLLDDVQADGSGRLVWGLLAALAGVEVGRWAVLLWSVRQWMGVWVHWHTVPRLNMLRSLVSAPGPAAGRLPGSPGEAVSRFRDDAKNVALVADVWLDITGNAVAALAATAVLVSVDARAAAVVVLPVLVAMGLTRRMGGPLKDLRLREREATAAVTGFLGDVFGAVQAVKGAGAEPAVQRRFARLGADRADATLRDQVATQALQTVSGATGNLSTGLALLVLAPSLAAGDATVGDVGLFASAAITLAAFPRWIARLGSYTRQADVSVTRMGRLLPDGAAATDLGAPVATMLRHGPGPAVTVPAAPRPDGVDRLRELEVRGLRVTHTDGGGVGPVDLHLRAGTITVVTGPVGAGKSTLLRALLGLVDVQEGEIRWNGQVVGTPSTWMVPPRVAYLPQVPRLFSESLADTILLGVDAAGLAEALHTACMDTDVTRMPEGLATMVGPRGVRLSGGQIQRTAAARAFVRRPDLLVVDDLSSALDVATETQVWDRLLDAPDRPTLLLVSHRRRVLDRADRVIRLEGPIGP